MRVGAMLFKPLEVMLLVDEALGNGIRERLEVERLIHGNRVFILNPVHHVHKPNVIRGHAPAVGKIAHYLENGLHAVLRLDNRLHDRICPRHIQAADHPVVEEHVRQRIDSLEIVRLRKEHIIQVGGFVEEQVDAHDEIEILQHFDLLVMVAPPFDGIAAVNKRGLDRLSAVQIGIALGQVEEMRVLSERLEGEHTHIGRLVLLNRLAHALVVRARDRP